MLLHNIIHIKIKTAFFITIYILCKTTSISNEKGNYMNFMKKLLATTSLFLLSTTATAFGKATTSEKPLFTIEYNETLQSISSEKTQAQKKRESLRTNSPEYIISVAAAHINFQLPIKVKEASIELLNLNGQQVILKTIGNERKKHTIDTTSLQNGIYIVRAISTEGDPQHITRAISISR